MNDGNKLVETKDLVTRLGVLLLQNNLCCTVAESCTGGLLAAALTAIPGSSQWFERGFITYSNTAKKEILAISDELIASQGAVSEGCACAMAQGALLASHAQCSIAVTGIAGPGGGSEQKPVGTVWIAWATPWRPAEAAVYGFEGDRIAVRQQAVYQALMGMIQRLEQGASR